MKRALLFCFVLLTGLATQAQTAPAKVSPQTSSTPAATAPKINPEKEADIRRLLEVSGGVEMARRMMQSSEQSIKPLMTKSLPPGPYREQLVDLFFEKFQSKADPKTLVDMVVPAYDKYLTHEEIKGLLQFYGTPLGKKSLSVLPKLVEETRDQGRAWGEQLGRQSMMEVLQEHPELAQQLEDAARHAQGQ
jgi:hypothetical protein